MPRKKIIPNSQNYYHITARCINREWFNIPMDDVWEITCNYLFFLSKAFHTEIYSYILMKNHFHALMRFPENNMADAMEYFMRECSRCFGKKAGRINQIWGGPYYKSEITDERYFLTAYKYLYRNAVAVGAVDRVEQYQYSTLKGLLGFKKLYVPLVEDFILFEDPSDTLKWLNNDFEEEQKKAIRNGLKRSQFAISNPNKQSELLIENLLRDFRAC